MIIQADVKGLEITCTAFNSQDKTLYKELNEGLDIHADNQAKFNLPDRVIAKIFVFKLLYGAMEYGFANDSDFIHVSSSPKYWRRVIDKFYEKYTGVYAWHERIQQTVGKTSRLDMFTGRSYKWDLMKFGSFKIPSTRVKNYPTQGLGADVVAMARVSLFKRWREAKLQGKLVNTVHDSIVADVPNKEVDLAMTLLYNVFSDLPAQISRIFDVNFDLKTNVEILVGNDMYNLKEAK